MAVEITSTHRSLFDLQHRDKSDYELQKLALDNISKIQSLPPNVSSAQLFEANNLLAEIELCNEELNLRKRKRESFVVAKTKWKEKHQEKINAAILNLPTAVTPNGQLVTAILEDDGDKTAQELAAWCEEFTAMPDEEFSALLKNLVNEGVIVKNKKTYSLTNICTKTLIPDDIVDRALKRIGPDKGFVGSDYIYYEFFIRLAAKTQEALSYDSFPEILDTGEALSVIRSMGYGRETLDKFKGILKLRKLIEIFPGIMSYGIFSSEYIKGSGQSHEFFYFKMLGEKEA